LKKGVIVRSSRKAGDRLSAESRVRLAALAKMPDNEIDLSDVPPLSYASERPFIKNPFYQPKKTQVTLRIDSDLLAWAKEGGAGYQTRINDMLRVAFVRHKLNELRNKTEEFLNTKAAEGSIRKRPASVADSRTRRPGAQTRASLGQQQSTAAKRRS
jgi:uncharacterized protein (DUF4415 family)